MQNEIDYDSDIQPDDEMVESIKHLPISYCSTSDMYSSKQNPLTWNKGKITNETHRTFAEEVRKISNHNEGEDEKSDWLNTLLKNTSTANKVEQKKKPKLKLIQYRQWVRLQ